MFDDFLCINARSQKGKSSKTNMRLETYLIYFFFRFFLFFILLTVSLNLLCFYIQQSSVYLYNSNHLILGEAVQCLQYILILFLNGILQKFHFYMLFSKEVIEEFWSGIVISHVSKNKQPSNEYIWPKKILIFMHGLKVSFWQFFRKADMHQQKWLVFWSFRLRSKQCDLRIMAPQGKHRRIDFSYTYVVICTSK